MTRRFRHPIVAYAQLLHARDPECLKKRLDGSTVFYTDDGHQFVLVGGPDPVPLQKAVKMARDMGFSKDDRQCAVVSETEDVAIVTAFPFEDTGATFERYTRRDPHARSLRQTLARVNAKHDRLLQRSRSVGMDSLKEILSGNYWHRPFISWFTDWIREVALPGVDGEAAIAELRDTLREFLRTTKFQSLNATLLISETPSEVVSVAEYLLVVLGSDVEAQYRPTMFHLYLLAGALLKEMPI